ncbi:MAG: hypothetical protein HY275_10435 [Gemmatimonadetes bacterium]|nr:hypothetical protein [Gemmatimonadota bacterium]
MIVGNVRHRLTRDDAQLVLRLVSRHDGATRADAEATLRDDGLDPLLDDPRLLEGLVRTPEGARASLPLFVYVIVRHALRAQGEREVRLADYVAAVVLEFGFRERAWRIAPSDDEVYETLAQLLADAEHGDPRRTFLVRAHLGNFALWLAGCFPDHIEHRRWRRGGPDLDYYDTLGARGFRLAADHRLAAEHGLVPVYARAAEHFGALRCALNAVSDALLFPHVHSPERLMRQVRDEGRWRLAS